MISSKELQNKYIKLYTELREYIWPTNTVEFIAELEIEVFSAFPNMDRVRKIFSNLKQSIIDHGLDLSDEDNEDLSEKLESFQNLLDSDDTETMFFKLVNTSAGA